MALNQAVDIADGHSVVACEPVLQITDAPGVYKIGDLPLKLVAAGGSTQHCKRCIFIIEGLTVKPDMEEIHRALLDHKAPGVAPFSSCQGKMYTVDTSLLHVKKHHSVLTHMQSNITGTGGQHHDVGVERSAKESERSEVRPPMESRLRPYQCEWICEQCREQGILMVRPTEV
eukprot:6482261-Amphidinium_carterae.2